MRLKAKKPGKTKKKRSASDCGDGSVSNTITDFDSIVGGDFDAEEFYNGIDEMMPEVLKSRQDAAMEDLFDFDLFEEMAGGGEIVCPTAHTMRCPQNAEETQWSIDDLF